MVKMVSSDVVVYSDVVVLRDDSSQVARVVWGIATAVAARPRRKDPRDMGCIFSAKDFNVSRCLLGTVVGEKGVGRFIDLVCGDSGTQIFDQHLSYSLRIGMYVSAVNKPLRPAEPTSELAEA
jgi:hypothetical protein